jgi:adenylate kinase family enzyme
MTNEMPDIELGRRIVIWGATGSGKTTLAFELGRRLGLGVVDLDAIRHANGWDSTPWDEFRAVLTKRLDSHPEGWITAGSYSAIMDVYLPRADTLIWLRLPWRVSFWRLLKRTISRARSQEEYYPGSPARESWRLSFFSRRSILLWSVTHHHTYARNFRARIAALPSGVLVYELKTLRQVEALLKAFPPAQKLAR